MKQRPSEESIASFQTPKTMKAIVSITLRSFALTIVSLFTLLNYATLDVYGFQNPPSPPQGQQVPIPSAASFLTTTPTATKSNKHIHHRHSTVLAMAGIPTLDKWKIISSGSVIGTVKNHPAIADGDVITTSPIQNPELAAKQTVVTTASGSKYKLLEPRGEISAAAKEREARALALAMAEAEDTEAFSNSNTKQQSSAPKPSFFGGWGGPFAKKSPSTEESTVNGSSGNDNSEARKKELLRMSPEWEDAARQYRLTGDTIGLEDEYLLASKPERSTSGKSSIWEAYRANEATGLPVDNAVPICMKISENLEAISREYENYRKLSFLGIWETGRFVRCYEFFPVAGYDKKFRNQCALAIERGARDLKSFLNSRGKLEKKELREACMSATQCVQALHNAGLVWTDMKTENFVVMPNGEVKGIDLESAMPINDYPVDYSPEACPPEFATAFLAGDGPYFELGTSYDIWSLGMLMLELSTGRGYFDGKTPAQITKQLRDMDETAMVSYLEGVDCDETLKDLIQRCLQKDPLKRPSTAQILMHPYFMAANPFSFLSLK